MRQVNDDYEWFFDEHYDRVRRVLAVASGDARRAEDAAQEAFARAYRAWGRVSEMSNPAGWVYVVAWNHVRRRRLRLRAIRVDDVAVPAATAGIEDRMLVVDLLRRLTARQRAAVVLRYLADLPYAQVAAALSCSESTARVTVHQAISRMRTELGYAPR